MNDRLHRTRMLFGTAAVQKLNDAHVMIVGCGAVGSFAIEALARSGVGNFILVDFDTIEESNINRQLFATNITIGTPKVLAAAERIHDICPDIHVDAQSIFFDENTKINCRPDFVIDAIDTVESKIALYKWCMTKNVPFISSMGAARKIDPTKIKYAQISETSVCPLAAKIRKIVREQKLDDFAVVYSTEVPNKTTAPNRTFGSVITVTGIFVLIMADYCIKNIIKS